MASEGAFPTAADARRPVSDITYERLPPASFWRRRARFIRDYVQSDPLGAVLAPERDFRPALALPAAPPPETCGLIAPVRLRSREEPQVDGLCLLALVLLSRRFGLGASPGPRLPSPGSCSSPLSQRTAPFLNRSLHLPSCEEVVLRKGAVLHNEDHCREAIRASGSANAALPSRLLSSICDARKTCD